MASSNPTALSKTRRLGLKVHLDIGGNSQVRREIDAKWHRFPEKVQQNF
jgi:hypothetical protein